MNVSLLLTALLCALSVELSWGDPDKIKIDPKTRLYVSREDGRVRVFHGLSLENNGSPNVLANYTDEQMAMLKVVSLIERREKERVTTAIVFPFQKLNMRLLIQIDICSFSGYYS